MDSFDRKKYPKTGLIHSLMQTQAGLRWLINFLFNAQDDLADGLMDEAQVFDAFKQAFIRPGLKTPTGRPIPPESIDFEWLYEQCKWMGAPSDWQKARLRKKLRARGLDPDQVDFPWDISLEEGESDDEFLVGSMQSTGVFDADASSKGTQAVASDSSKREPLRNCPLCNKPNQPEAKQCVFCGNMLDPVPMPQAQRSCPTCGEEALPGAKYCRFCMQPLPDLDRHTSDGGPVRHAREESKDGPDALEEPEFMTPIRVLLVDDVRETRDCIRKALERAGDIIVVGEATTGVEGIECYAELLPEVVCTNINMPVMDGIRMTKEICTRFPGAQVFIHSVQNEPEYMRAAMLAGARDFIAKPAADYELYEVVYRLGRDYREKQAERLKQEKG